MSDSKDSKESKKPLVVVVGATGSQGGSVIEHLLKTKKYSLRGITRKVDSDASKKLISQGVEMAAADIRDKDALTKAFAGADFLYAVTNFWDPETMKKHDEVAQGKTLVDAAHAAGVKHIIWSGLDNVTEGSGGRIKDVHHFTGKHEVETYIKKLGLSASFVYAGFYAQNFSSFFPLKKASDDVWELTLPLRADVGIPIFDVSDTGIFVATVIANWTKYEGKIVRMAASYTTLPQVIQIVTKVTGKKTRYIRVDADAFEKAAGREMAAMFQQFNEYGYFFGADLTENATLFPDAKTYEQYVQAKGSF